MLNTAGERVGPRNVGVCPLRAIGDGATGTASRRRHAIAPGTIACHRRHEHWMRQGVGSESTWRDKFCRVERGRHVAAFYIAANWRSIAL